jgi:hypothetical protein
MNSVEDSVDIVMTEAVEGDPQNHYFDEYGNRPEKKLPPFIFNLELIKKPNGSYEWLE